ncbi:MAG: type I restriction endonuclease subunit R [Candidatus Methanomethylophilaceae archaeon]
MSKAIAESDFEELLIDFFTEQGYSYLPGPTISPDGESPERNSYSDVVLKVRLKRMLSCINPGINDGLINDAVRKIMSISSNSLIAANQEFHEMLIQGVRLESKRKDGTIAGEFIKIIDFDNPEKNEFLAVNQFTIINEGKERRPDVILFVNGLPLVVIELKNPADEKATINNAFTQIQNYKNELPQLFYYNEGCIIADGVFTEVGTISSGYQHFVEWKSMDPEDKIAPILGTAELMVQRMFNKETYLDLVKNYTVFDDDGTGNKIKKVAKYHQYYAVNAAIDATVKAVNITGDGKCGIVWHTQGSGKSLTMTFYAGKIARDKRMENPTIVVLTDRIDLDDQLFGTFSNCSNLLRQVPQQADSRDDLRNLLRVASGGIVFTTINKFLPAEDENRYPMLSDRRNIVVIVDEAHRSQYDMVDGFGANIRDALPNASFIAFTGTPIDFSDRSTVNVFGQCISIYDISKSIEDKTTVPIYYESRLVKIDLPDDQKELLNQSFENISEDMEATTREKEKCKWAMLESLVGVDSRLEHVAKDIVGHFEKRLEAMDGKAMIVCMSRRICVELYDHIVKLRPEWAGHDDNDSVINVIMTGSATDPVEWQKHIRNKLRRNEMALRFKDPKDPFKLVIVRDMWLTGFDAPCLHTMYIDKPMKDHGLMQAISRVNRVFGDKPGGLVVDYIGIADNLAKAVGTYTRGGGKGEVYIDTSQAVPLFFTKYEICCQLMHGYDWSWWSGSSKKDRIRKLTGAADFVLKQDNGAYRIRRNVTELTNAFNLVNTDSEVLGKREDVAFFQSLRAYVVKLVSPPSKKPAIDPDIAIRQVLSSAIVSQEPTDVLELLGYDKADISILSEEFLSRIRKMPEKNLAAELLKSMLQNNIVHNGRQNIVQSKKFSELIEESITKYEKHIIDTTQFINILIQLANEMNEANKRGIDLGLTKDELAFYDALGTDDAAVKLMGDEVLRTIAMDVARAVSSNMTVDWSVREQAKAKMRLSIKRLLTKYGYPPDKKEDATKLIIEQAEQICKLKAEA